MCAAMLFSVVNLCYTRYVHRKRKPVNVDSNNQEQFKGAAVGRLVLTLGRLAFLLAASSIENPCGTWPAE